VHLRENGKPLLYAQGTFAIAKALAVARRKRRAAAARQSKAAAKAAKRA
jgi:hypothetical protein